MGDTIKLITSFIEFLLRSDFCVFSIDLEHLYGISAAYRKLKDAVNSDNLKKIIDNLVVYIDTITLINKKLTDVDRGIITRKMMNVTLVGVSENVFGIDRGVEACVTDLINIVQHLKNKKYNYVDKLEFLTIVSYYLNKLESSDIKFETKQRIKAVNRYIDSVISLVQLENINE